MGQIIALFSSISAILQALFANQLTQGTQLLQLGQKLTANLSFVKTQLEQTIDANKQSFETYKLDAQAKFNTINNSLNNIPGQINQAVNISVAQEAQRANAYVDGRIAEVKLATNSGMRGFIPIRSVVGGKFYFTKEEDVQTLVAPYLNGEGQYILDITTLGGDGSDIDDMVDGSMELLFEGPLDGDGKPTVVSYAVDNDEKVIISYDGKKYAFVTRDDNYTAKILQGFVVSLEGLKQVAEAAKNQSDKIKAQIDDFLNSI